MSKQKLNYVKGNDYNYLSYGKKHGKFLNTEDEIYNYIIENKTLNGLALVEVRTPIIKLYFDIDLKDDDLLIYPDINCKKLSNYVVKTINKNVLEYIFNSNYIYLDKNKGNGIHLLYPKILITAEYCIILSNLIVDDLVLNCENGYSYKLYRKIMDESVYKNSGLRMLYQPINGCYYKVNKKKSSYKNISSDDISLLKQVSIKTSAIKCNFKSKFKKVIIPITVKENKSINISENKIKGNILEFNETPYIKKLIHNDQSLLPRIENILREGIKLVSVDRNNNYPKWFELGVLCYQFGKLGISLWVEFSKNYPGFDINEINRMLKSFYYKENGYTLRTLIHIIKEDNKNSTIYKSFMLKNKGMLDIIYKTEETMHIDYLINMYDLCDEGFIKLYYNKFKDIIVCSDVNADKFYMYNDINKLWMPVNFKQIQLHFIETMKEIVMPLVDYYRNKSNSCKDMINAKVFDKKAELVKYNAVFCTASRSKYIIPLLSVKFYDDRFMNNLNSDPLVLPVKGGIINLKTGEYRKRTMNDKFSFELNAEWKGLEYKTPNIEKFISDIMLGDVDMINYLQKLLGYSISGLVNNQLFCLFWGSGGNGKGVLMNLLKNLMSYYYEQVDSSVILKADKNRNGATPYLVKLLGCRLAFVDESDMDGKLNEGIVKNITGGGAITARALYGSPITFDPTFQLFLLTNHKPEINCNESLKRRIILIPFLAEFKSKQKYDKTNKYHRLGDNLIEHKLNEKLDELLVWLIKGSIKYFKNGFDKLPKQINKATDDYFNENDDIGDLIKEYCIIDIKGFISHKDLYDLYLENYGNELSKRTFTSTIKNKGFLNKKSKGVRGFIGLKKKPRNLQDFLN